MTGHRSSPIPLSFIPHRRRTLPLPTPRAPQPLHHVGEQGIPPRHRSEGLRPSLPRVPALASNVDDVLAEVVGELDDVERWAGWDHRRKTAAKSDVRLRTDLHTVFGLGRNCMMCFSSLTKDCYGGRSDQIPGELPNLRPSVDDAFESGGRSWTRSKTASPSGRTLLATTWGGTLTNCREETWPSLRGLSTHE